MSKKIRCVCILLVIVVLHNRILFSHTISVKLPEEPFMPPEVKIHIDKTFSVYPVERAEAAFQLGLMGGKAQKAVPFLMRLLDDNIPVWCRYNGYGTWTTTGKEASKAIALIGAPASNYLLMLVKGTHPYVFINVFMEKNLRFALNKITGADYGNDFKQWSGILEQQKTEQLSPEK